MFRQKKPCSEVEEGSRDQARDVKWKEEVRFGIEVKIDEREVSTLDRRTSC